MAEVKIPSQASTMPSSRGMLQLVRTELKSDIRAVRSDMKAGFARSDGEVATLRSEMKAGFARVDGEFASVRSEMRSGFSRVDAKLELVVSEVARLGVLVEEQNANNRIVLEGLSSLWQRQDQFESRLTDEVERAVASAFIRHKS
jgi:hypothetical protein